jgi:hypothetical protein
MIFYYFKAIRFTEKSVLDRKYAFRFVFFFFTFVQSIFRPINLSANYTQKSIKVFMQSVRYCCWISSRKLSAEYRTGWQTKTTKLTSIFANFITNALKWLQVCYDESRYRGGGTISLSRWTGHALWSSVRNYSASGDIHPSLVKSFVCSYGFLCVHVDFRCSVHSTLVVIASTTPITCELLPSHMWWQTYSRPYSAVVIQ